ncbi:DoxX family protein [Erythrobacter sp. T5W1-R]|uniref:DoxX family protein n=1 Tax=Erythrobacter sp. T5W1-R TaxID=3101752 RepID=UPI002AFE9FB2|nr:DoxX family protein [Erythrobacter sp. T5W1-R]MEA1620003.1 DoxX family protein [Erythrobacter sp. T5W1-R]
MRAAARPILRWVLALFYALAGVIHLVRPAPFLTIMPSFVPAPEAVVLLTGVAEIAGALGLIQPFSARLRRWAGWGLALYALCVWPANINHFIIDMARADGGLGLGYHIPRMFAQPAIIGLALWVGDCLPLRRRAPAA